MSPSGDTARLFVALWPDAAVREGLVAEAEAWQWPATARRVDATNLHLTLHFIGAFGRDRLGALEAALAAIPPRPIALQATDRAVWRGGIAVLTFDLVPSLEALHREVGDALRGLGVALETRPFRPHATLARKAAGAVPPTALPALDWAAAGHSLVESKRGPPVRYERLAAWGAPVGNASG